MPEDTPIEQLPSPGAIPDARTKEEKEKDYVFSEIVSAIEPVVWVEKPQSEWRKFPISNQDSSGSCVAQTLRKMYGVYLWLKTGYYVDISASHIYQRRSNRPAAGMGGVDVFMIGQTGTTLNSFAPSDNMTDAQMDNILVNDFMKRVGEVFKLGKYVVVSPTDIDTIASIIQATGKAVMVWFYFKYDEWGNVPVVLYPNLDLYAPSTNRHSLAAVDFTLYQGKKALIIDESWGLTTAMNGQRVITEDFFKARNWFAAHFQNFVFEDIVVKPNYSFTKPLNLEMTDQDVVKLQDVLKYEGLFPTNVTSTGYYGNVTRKGVLAFQKKYSVAPNAELDALQGKRVGTQTLKKLNELYNS
jgi:putative peptidoglycan binding protein